MLRTLLSLSPLRASKMTIASRVSGRGGRKGNAEKMGSNSSSKPSPSSAEEQCSHTPSKRFVQMCPPGSRLRQAVEKLRSRQKQMDSKRKWARTVDPISLEIADVKQLGAKIKKAWRSDLAVSMAIGQDPILPSPEEMDVEQPATEPAPKPYRIPRKQSNEDRAPLPSHPSNVQQQCSIDMDLEAAQPLEEQALPDTFPVEEGDEFLFGEEYVARMLARRPLTFEVGSSASPMHQQAAKQHEVHNLSDGPLATANLLLFGQQAIEFDMQQQLQQELQHEQQQHQQM